MALRVETTPTFDRTAKKLHANQKQDLDAAVKAIMVDPAQAGTAKKGDLAGVHVHKFKSNRQEVLLSYVFDEEKIVLLALGSHENFYRDMKR